MPSVEGAAEAGGKLARQELLAEVRRRQLDELAQRPLASTRLLPPRRAFADAAAKRDQHQRRRRARDHSAAEHDAGNFRRHPGRPERGDEADDAGQERGGDDQHVDAGLQERHRTEDRYRRDRQVGRVVAAQDLERGGTRRQHQRHADGVERAGSATRSAVRRRCRSPYRRPPRRGSPAWQDRECAE